MLRGEEVGNWVVGDEGEVVVVVVVEEEGEGVGFFARAECAWKAARRFVRKGLLLVGGIEGMVLVVVGETGVFFGGGRGEG